MGGCYRRQHRPTPRIKHGPKVWSRYTRRFTKLSSIQYESREEFLHKIRKDLTGLGKGNAFFKQVEDPNLYRLGIRYLPPGDDQRTLNAVEELKPEEL